MFKRAQGLDVVHVPYQALAAAIDDLARGDVHLLFGTSGSVVPAIQGRRLRALAVAGPRRPPALREVLAEPETVRFLETNGSEPFPTGAPEFGQLLASESDRWARFVRETGLTAD